MKNTHFLEGLETMHRGILYGRTQKSAYFGRQVYQKGSLVITSVVRPCVCPSVRPSLNISETAHWFFLIFCLNLGHLKGTKVTQSQIFEKNLGGSQMGGNPHFGGIFDVFCPYLCIQSLKVSEISYTL